MTNPYTSRGPVHDARMFYGREYLLNEVGAFIQGNQSISIVGPRKIGKTSLVLHLFRGETLAALNIERDNIFIYLDCQVLSNCKQEEIFTYFCIEIAAALRAQKLEPEPALKTAISTATWSSLDIALRKLNQRGLRVVLILDEFEQLTINPHVDMSFYNALRSAAGRLRLVFLTCSALPLIELTYFDTSKKILSSPFFNIFAQVFLGLLSETEARELIRTPMEAAGFRVSSRLEDFIYRLVGGHPLALQIACFHAWDNLEDLQKIKEQTMQELEAHFQYYWHNLKPVERDVLHNPAEAGLQEVNNPKLAIALRDLARKCLLVRSEGSYRYPSDAWAEFVSAHSRYPTLISPIEPPIDSEIAGEHEQRDYISPDLQEPISLAADPKKLDSSLQRVIRESLPEIIGGIVVAIFVGLTGLIYTQFTQLLELAKSIYARIGPVWLVLAILAILVLGIATAQIGFRRRRDK